MKSTAGVNSAVASAIILVFDLAMLFISTALYQNGTVDFAGVIIPTMALFSSFGSVAALAALGSTLQNTFAAGNRILDILDETPITEEITGKTEISFSGAATNNATFSYGGDKILDNVSVEIRQNKIIGIVGKSGSGKSTLLKLFMHFRKCGNGAIDISGTNVDEINANNLRDMESFMTQETHLFRYSIRSNISIAKLDVTDIDRANTSFLSYQKIFKIFFVDKYYDIFYNIKWTNSY